MISIIQHSRLWYTFSGVLVTLACILLIYPGLKLGIDFTGGTLIEVAFTAAVEQTKVEDVLVSFGEEQGVDIGQPYVLSTSEGGFIIRIKSITNEQHIALQESFRSLLSDFTEKRFMTIGPTVGETLKTRSLWALLAATVVIALNIAFSFRNVPRKLNPLKFGVIAVIALVHDMIITAGFFVFLGTFTSFEVNILFVTALLVILGYSVSDTIVIFDRVRENVFNQERGDNFAEIAERGLQQSIARSVHTSVSALIPITVLFILGGESIRWFVLTLIVGITLGTYSSMFLATPLLVHWRTQK